MSKRRIVGIGAYVAVVLLLGVGAWWVITPGAGSDPPVDGVLPAAERQPGSVDVWDRVGFSVVRERTAEDRQADLHIQEGERDEGILAGVRDWVKGLSAIATLLGVVGWLVGVLVRHVDRNLG